MASFIIRLLGLSCIAVSLSALTAEALTLSGKVTKDGVPARYARLYVSGQQKLIRADKTGAFSLTISSPGTYTITPVLQSNLISTPFNRVVTISSADITDLNFSLSRVTEKATIRGRVLGSTGAPILNASIQISGVGRVTTDANGVFVRTGLAAGSYVLTANASGSAFSPALKRVKATTGKASRANFRGKPLAPGASYPAYLSGVFKALLNRTAGQCSALPSSVSEIITVVQNKDRVKVSLPTLGSATLKADSSGFEGDISKRRQGCKLTGKLKVTYTSQFQGTVLGTAVLSCPGQPNCSGEFTGIFMRE